MHAEIISIGTEILMGEIVDTNSAYLASELAKLGIDVRWVSKVGDDPERMFDVLDRAWKRSDVTITTGGLGPTSDDLTRESIALVFSEEMAVQEDLLIHLKSTFTDRGIEMPETNIKQATLIPSATTVPNPMGTAPGWWAEKEGKIIIAMPGPPRELQRMWSYEAKATLKEKSPNVAIVTRTLKTFGITEGGLDEMVKPLFSSINPTLGIYSRDDGIHLRAIATAPTEQEALDLIGPMESHIREVAGSAIWGMDDDTPEGRVASLLVQNGESLGVAELFTGGLLVSTLAGVNNRDDFLLGGIVLRRNYSSPDVLCEDLRLSPSILNKFGPESAEVATDAAEAAQKRFGATVGIALMGVASSSTNASGPTGTCHIGFAIGKRKESISGLYSSNSSRSRSRAVTTALLGLAQALGRDI